MAGWYSEAAFLLYLEHHWSGPLPTGERTGPDADQVARLLDQVQPDALQVTAKAQSGFVPYPTRYGNRWPALDANPWDDPLEVYQEACRTRGVPLILAVSTLVDRHQAYWRADWQRVTTDRQPYPHQALCCNSGYVDELLLPQLDELLERYQPAGLWLDGENWTVAPCYCAACESEFQMLRERSAPINAGDPLWPEWLEFQRESFQRYLSRVARYLHDRHPELVLASNAAYASHQAEPACDGCDRLCWDLSPAYSLRQAGLEARVLGGHELPFDLITWNRCSPRPYPSGRLPALPAYPKSRDHLCQEGAAILAGGGRWTVWASAGTDGLLFDEEFEVVTGCATFARERRALLGETVSAAEIAVLHADATHRRAGNGLYDPGPSLDRIRGAHQALTELHLPHDIVTEGRLRAELERYRLVVLPEQLAFPDWLDSLLAEWVQGGGCLLATGQISPRLEEAVPVFALEELLGVRWTGRRREEAWFRYRDRLLRLAAPTWEMASDEAEAWLPLLEPDCTVVGGAEPAPFVHRRPYGTGQTAYIAADFFAAYHRCQYPGLRHLLGELLAELEPEPQVRLNAGPAVEVSLRRREDSLVVHLAHHSPGKSLAQNSAFVEEVPPTGPWELALRGSQDPRMAALVPGGAPVEWTRDGAYVRLQIPEFQIHCGLVLEGMVDTDS
ncbi:MAG: hypothetical protein FJX77_00700 [Armatimonadetes bacterium]|nr:hypothetical protein [Armatimonadota bacterium]